MGAATGSGKSFLACVAMLVLAESVSLIRAIILNAHTRMTIGVSAIVVVSVLVRVDGITSAIAIANGSVRASK